MPRRGSPALHVAASERARALLERSAPAGDPRVIVLGVLLRRPRAAVTYMELRAETQPLEGEHVDVALAWLLGHGFAESDELAPYGVVYRAVKGVGAEPRAGLRSPLVDAERVAPRRLA